MKKHRKSRVLGSKISLISGVFIFIPLIFHFFHSTEHVIFVALAGGTTGRMLYKSPVTSIWLRYWSHDFQALPTALVSCDF
jgi:hypothetical protein